MRIENIKLANGLTIKENLRQALMDNLLSKEIDRENHKLKEAIKSYLEDAGYLCED